MRLKKIPAALAAVLCLSAMNVAAAAERYEIDAVHAFVNFTVAHFTGKARGSFGDVGGTIVFDEIDVTKSSVEVRIRTASVNTNNERRDAHLRGPDFFDAERFPEMTFKSRRVERKGAAYVAVGDLTIRGVTKEVSMPFTLSGPMRDPLPAGVKRLLVEASLRVDRRDFGMMWSRVTEAGGLFVGNEVSIDINVEAVVPKPAAGQTAAQTPSPATTDGAAVRRAVEKLARDFNGRDARAVMSSFAADVVLVSPDRPDVDYKTMDEGFAKAYERPLATPYGVVTKIEEIGVSGDLAFVRLMWLREAKDDGRLLRREKDFEIWRRQADGRWKLARGYSFTFEGDFPAAEPRAATAPHTASPPQVMAPDARRRDRPAPSAADDVSAVKAALENLLRAYNRRDLEAAVAAYAPDSLLSYPGTPDSGREHARAAYARRFANAPPFPVTISFRLEELHASGDLAFARLLWLVERDSDKKTLSRHRDLEVWKRQPDGSWALYRGLSFHLPADRPAGSL
jgi:polyisoprenoid-binding protein YceI/ketosteroid isomerase-like protein